MTICEKINKISQHSVMFLSIFTLRYYIKTKNLARLSSYRDDSQPRREEEKREKKPWGRGWMI